eukprot:2014786-Amphidinium_carterae.4
MQLLDAKLSWSLSFGEAEEVATPCSTIQPTIVSYLFSGDRMHYWPPTPTSKKCATSGVHPGWHLMLDSAAASSDSDDDSMEDPDAIEEPDLAEMLEHQDVLWEVLEQVGQEPDLANDSIMAHEPGAEIVVPDKETGATLATEDPPLDVQMDQTQTAMASSSMASRTHVCLGREHAEAIMEIHPHGRIAWHSSKQSFEATCWKHKRCIMTRASFKGAKAHGRPLGFLMAWLQMTVDDPALHRDKDYLRGVLQADCRRSARRVLSDMAGSATLLSKERPLEEGEAEEPDNLKGLL